MRSLFAAVLAALAIAGGATSAEAAPASFRAASGYEGTSPAHLHRARTRYGDNVRSAPRWRMDGSIQWDRPRTKPRHAKRHRARSARHYTSRRHTNRQHTTGHANRQHARPRHARSAERSRRRAHEHAGRSRRAAHRAAYRTQRRAGRLARIPVRAYRVRALPAGSDLVGVASYYWQGQKTATGARFNPEGMTAAHRTLPFGTRVRVTNLRNGRSVVVRINDRGPYIAGRIIDLSRGAAGVIGMHRQGVARVRVTVLDRS